MVILAAVADYHRLSIAGKQAAQRDSMRESSVVCPSCETHTTPADLLSHQQTRCTGPRDPHPASKWINWREATDMGVPGATLTRWTQRGEVRFLGERQDRKYLMRDVVLGIANRRANRRR